MLIFFIVIIGLSLLILGHEFGHFLAARFFKLRVEEFGIGFPPRIFAWRPKAKEKGTPRSADGSQGETEYSFNWLPFGGFVKIAGETGEFALKKNGAAVLVSDEEKKRLFSFQPAWKRAIVLSAGIVMNFLLGWLLLSIILAAGTPSVLLVEGVQVNSPAAQAGFKQGDIFVDFKTAAEFSAFVDARRGEEVALRIKRDGGEVRITAIPRVTPPEGEGALGVRLAEGGSKPQNIFSALYNGLTQTVLIVGVTVSSLFDLLFNLFTHGRLVSDVVGPVGIFTVAQQTGSIGLIYLIQLLSLISLNLAVVNLIPFPALDGGRLFLLIIEKFKGSPISRRVEMYLNGVGFVFLLLLMAIITIRDVARLF